MSVDLAVASRRSLPVSFRHLTATVHLTDAALIVLTSIATGCAYRYATAGVLGEVNQFAATGMLAACLIVGLNAALGLSRPAELLKPRKQARVVFGGWLFALFVVLVTAFAWHVSADFSRAALGIFFASGASLMAGGRLLWSRLLRSALQQERLKVRRTAVLFPETLDRQELARELANLRQHGLKPLWQIALPAGQSERGGAAFPLPGMLRGTNVDEVIVLADWADAAWLLEGERLGRLPVPVRYLPLGEAKLLGTRPREQLGDSVLIELQRGSLSGAERCAKMAFDKAVAAATLLALAPLFAMVAVLIKRDSAGPVFFRQTRRGFNGRPFEIWKFRTMRVSEAGGVVRQAVVDDPRVTRVGRWLRRASFDELPQLINVLRGEMSLVGPRPHAVSHDDHYDTVVAEYARRHHVLPGLTGWAQVHGARGETPTVEHMRRRVELDLWYVQNWSFRRDLAIIAGTVWHVLTTRSAY